MYRISVFRVFYTVMTTSSRERRGLVCDPRDSCARAQSPIMEDSGPVEYFGSSNDTERSIGPKRSIVDAAKRGEMDTTVRPGYRVHAVTCRFVRVVARWCVR